MLACHQTELLYVAAAATGASLVSAAVFMVSVLSRFRKTFYKPYSWARQAVDRWEIVPFHFRIALITTRNPQYWPKEQVRAFIAENWERWTREKPAWFVDPLWRESVPAWALPDDQRHDGVQQDYYS